MLASVEENVLPNMRATRKSTAANGMKEVYSTHEAARICRVTPMTVIRWIEDGRIPAFKTAGGHRRIHRPDLEAFCRDRGIPCDPLHVGRRRVLVIANDPEELEALAAAARGSSPEVVVDVARDAFEGGRILMSSRPHLVILDQRANGADVRDVCERMKSDSTLGTVELVVFGPSPDSEEARALRTRGAFGCLRRPVDAAAVRSAVRAALGLGADVPTRRARVLVVDDDALFNRALRRELERRGVEVLVAERGVDALLLMGSAKPDLVLLDLQLPDIDGLEVTKRLRARPETAEVALVAMSGRADEKMRRKLVSAGALAFLHKPFAPEDVLALIPMREAAAAV
jgi:excisionase family DNA binding protein